MPAPARARDGVRHGSGSDACPRLHRPALQRQTPARCAQGPRSGFEGKGSSVACVRRWSQVGLTEPTLQKVPKGQGVVSPVSGDGVAMGSQSPHYRKVPKGQGVVSPVSGDGVAMGSQSPHYRKVPKGQMNTDWGTPNAESMVPNPAFRRACRTLHCRFQPLPPGSAPEASSAPASSPPSEESPPHSRPATSSARTS